MVRVVLAVLAARGGLQLVGEVVRPVLVLLLFRRSTDRSILLRGVSSSHFRSPSRFGHSLRRSPSVPGSCERSLDLVDLAAQPCLGAFLFLSIRVFTSSSIQPSGHINGPD